MAISPFSLLASFKRNCPNVRMTREEEDELLRIIRVGMNDVVLSERHRRVNSYKDALADIERQREIILARSYDPYGNAR